MRGLEELLAKTDVCARDGMPEECLGRFTEDAFNERVDVCLRQPPLKSANTTAFSGAIPCREA